MNKIAIIEQVLGYFAQNEGYNDLQSVISGCLKIQITDTEYAVIEDTIKEENLLERVRYGYKANAVTRQIVEDGGYAKWLHSRKEIISLREKALESSYRQIIVDEARKKEKHIMDRIALGVSCFALILSIIALCKA